MSSGDFRLHVAHCIIAPSVASRVAAKTTSRYTSMAVDQANYTPSSAHITPFHIIWRLTIKKI